MARAKTARTIEKTNGQKTNGQSTSQPEVKKASTSALNPDSAANQALLEEQIRFRAYQLFEQRGKTHGHAHEDWVRAEAELRSGQSNRSA